MSVFRDQLGICFMHHDGREFSLDELAHQLWRGDKAIRERFYYDPTQQRN